MKAKALKFNPQLKPVSGGYLHGRIVEHNLMATNPLKKQFEPTDQSPVRQRFKMAGGCD
jgi:hypothetical protein